MDSAVREHVRTRARGRCEYCHLLQVHTNFVHHVEHITAKQHGGSDDVGNLAWACHRCNLRKGPNLTGIDPKTGRLARLFNPRRQRWTEHFKWIGLQIEGTSPSGRATVRLLQMNDAGRLEQRKRILGAETPLF